ncbi:MAG: hypothetical protein ABFD50_17920 [Smithella sp.]
MKIGDKVQMIGVRPLGLKVTGVLVSEDICKAKYSPHTGRWLVKVDEPCRSIFACISEDGIMAFWPDELKVIE